MKKRLTMIKPLVFACSVALTACGGSSDGTTATTPTTVTGLAEAPGGVIAQFEDNKSYLVAAIEYVFPGAYAGITGLDPVTGATVQLIRIDNDGNQVGAVLAETVTSITGTYSLALPTGVSLAGDLVVRITGNGGASMSAMVVDQAVNINPISQFVLDKFVDDDNLVLADLALNEVVALSGKVDEFDLTATSDLSTMLALLEAEVGQFVDNEIAVIEATPDDGTQVAAVAGSWHTVEMSMGLHDADNINYGTFAMDIFSEEFVFSDSGNTDLNLTLTVGQLLIDTFTNFSVFDFTSFNIYHEINLTSDSDTFPANIDADGNISLSFGFEEDLQTVDTQVDVDGPDYGWRYPPGSILFEPVVGGNIYVTNFNDAGVRYETIDTNADGVKDAIDPAKKDGDEASLSLSLIMKEGSGMSTASLSGEYGGVFLNLNLDTSPVAVYDSTVGILGFDGAGNVTRDALAFNVREITRTPGTTAPAVNLAHVQSTEPASPDGFTYTVLANGQVTLNTGGSPLEGYASNDGSVMAVLGDESTGSPIVTNVNNEMLVFVKLGAGVDTAMAGATYKLYAMGLNADTDGSSEVFSIGNGVATFNADATAVAITGVDRGVMRSSDVAQIAPLTADVINETFTVDNLTSKGKVTMSSTTTGTSTTETTTLRGFISGDKKMLVLRLFSDILFSDISGTSQEYDLGMVIGVKQ